MDCFRMLQTEIMDYFWAIQSRNFGIVLGNPETDFRTVIDQCVLFVCYC